MTAGTSSDLNPGERSLIERKLGQIAERLSYLERYASEGFEAYAPNFERRKAAEKIIQEIIDAALDVNAHVLAQRVRAAERDAQNSFTEMAERGYLSLPLAARLAPAMRLRNQLAPHDETLDDRKVFDAIMLSAELFPVYIANIRDLLD